MTLRVVQFGCRPIGCNMVRPALPKANIEIVGAIDLANVGRDLGDVAGLAKKVGITISEGASTVLNTARPNAVLHAKPLIWKKYTR